MVADFRLMPSYISWTGWRAVGTTSQEAAPLWKHAQMLKRIGIFAAELEVVPDHLGKFLSQNASLVMLGMGQGNMPMRK